MSRQVLSKYQPVEEDVALKALDALQVQEEDYFCRITHAVKLMKEAQRALAVPGSYLDVFTVLMCTQLQVRYERLTEQERTVLKNVMKKSPAF